MQFATPENQLDEVSVFPNPASDKVTIQCTGMTSIEVFSIDGRLVQNVKVEGDVCQVEGLNSGIYVICILKDELVLIRRLIIQ